MERIEGTIYWKHNQYEIYEDTDEIHIWERVYNKHWDWDETLFVARFTKRELRNYEEAACFQRQTADEPFALAMELIYLEAEKEDHYPEEVRKIIKVLRSKDEDY